MANTNEELIKQMYGANLESQKQQLTQSHNAGNSALDEAKKQNQAAADANLNRTAVEAQKKAMADAEIQNAYGLSSGTAAQVRLARDNQTAADMAAIRTAQQEADAQVERERALLSQEYTSAIQKAQADNDLELAKALYENAQAEEQKLLAKAEAENARFKQELEAAKYLAEQTGDFSPVDEVYAKYLGGVYLEKVSQENYNTLLSDINSGYDASKVDGWLIKIEDLAARGVLTPDHAAALQVQIRKLAAQGAQPPQGSSGSQPGVWTPTGVNAYDRGLKVRQEKR